MIGKGSVVQIHYTLEVDGEVLDTSRGKSPLTYTQGAGQLITGLEEELEGLAEGETKAVSLSPDKAYGSHNPEAVHRVPRGAFENPDNLKVGDMVKGRAAGQEFQAQVSDLGEEEVTLDLNHPLAGKTLHFDVEVVKVE